MRWLPDAAEMLFLRSNSFAIPHPQFDPWHPPLEPQPHCELPRPLEDCSFELPHQKWSSRVSPLPSQSGPMFEFPERIAAFQIESLYQLSSRTSPKGSKPRAFLEPSLPQP